MSEFQTAALHIMYKTAEQQETVREKTNGKVSFDIFHLCTKPMQ